MKLTFAAIPLLVVIALAGCATAAPADSSSPTAAESAAPCEVSIVVDFGVLDAPQIEECGAAGAAADAVEAAGITTEGTVDFGDQVVCRVNDRPAADETVTLEGQPEFVEACQSMPSASAYWALWVKASPDAEWEYAQEGLGTLQLADGESIGLVYTAGTESTPPSS
ncbi:hypothetical protein QMG83_01290 [Salinibacterium sp. G-O1]|uniref:hypothetical protein n=1 Tax=Salinibacterium sp. G-O1 TaxID=3046208 RepID=UPI0024B9F77D|nr:hypothetical protein [Salinibacterium sp. G-O1]MDJ0333851.1 hypothetical protein [Salinibacterium sp. G-O1]